jgi:hypothetical protein
LRESLRFGCGPTALLELLRFRSRKAVRLDDFFLILAHFGIVLPRQDGNFFAAGQLLMDRSGGVDGCGKINFVENFLSFGARLEFQP